MYISIIYYVYECMCIYTYYALQKGQNTAWIPRLEVQSSGLRQQIPVLTETSS